MFQVTGAAQQEAWRRKVLPAVERVRDGVWSVPVPFPGNPMRYTLAYVLVTDRDCVVIDPGFDSDEGWRHLGAGLRTAGLGHSDVTAVVATHFHTDHLGLARRLASASGAWIGMGSDERRYISDYEDVAAEVSADQRRMAAWGVPPDRVPEAAMSATSLADLKGLADADVRLDDDQYLPVPGMRIRAQATPGHTPGHICLRDEAADLLFSGDHILPRISPNVSLEIRGMDNPLLHNLRSLQKLSGASDSEVCPAHEYRFRGLAERATQLHEHAMERSAEVMDAVLDQASSTVWTVAKALTWSRGWDSLSGLQLRLALSETAAHLAYLRSQGEDISVPGLALTDWAVRTK
ncbi:MBL fold metallo-hydrolase [Arthrobacter sp. USHLN218]|uniref:MBL fold metallo-hydrolase n=1 Tax=Arthrobacter sp. USHLN218 TaxID=3081232 RepID=UPI0030177BBC